MPRYPAVILSCSLLIAAGCSKTTDRDRATGVRLDLDRLNEQPYVEFYFGPYAPPGSTIFESGLIQEQSGSFFLDLKVLASVYSFASELQAPASDGILTWEELSPFMSAHYYDVVGAPPSLADFLDRADQTDIDWMDVEVDGVMTNATRHVLIPKSAVRKGLEEFSDNGEQLLYPVGTRILADHVINDAVAETTAMQKRTDGYWDFFVFDSNGQLAAETATPPKNLVVPTQCAGCHLGSRLYDPEKSFPGTARPGPDGPRRIHVGDRQKNSKALRFLDEHRKRSDGILGLYGTIYLANLLADRGDGTINAEDAALLNKLGL